MAPAWQPTSSNGGAEEDGAPRCGTLRATMKNNPLLARAELGRVKPTMFSNPPAEHVFGYTVPKDPEGAREVTMMWKEHSPTGAGAPTPDFKHMNKTAAKSGLTTAKQLPAFRASNMTTIKKFDHTKKAQPPLPSDVNRTFTYGKPSVYRDADTVRQCGPVEPMMKHLIQGAYQDEWVRNNLANGDQTQGQGTYIPPVPTRAVLGHAIGATKYLQPHHTGEEWKMSKFKKVPSRVSAYMGITRGPGAADQQQQQQQQGYAAAGQHVAEEVHEQYLTEGEQQA